MAEGKLSRLQQQIIAELAHLEPKGVVTGGAALVGFHLAHRTTRDIDLFFRGLSQLGRLPETVLQRLTGSGLGVTTVQRSPGFCRLRVTDGAETCVVDLVAEPVAAIEAPLQVEVGGEVVLIDSRHEILVNKLCAVLGRSEIRDLVDLQHLLRDATEDDLIRAVGHAGVKDGGFSPMTLAWVLRSLEVAPLAAQAGFSKQDIDQLDRFRDVLVSRIAQLARPDEAQ